MAVGFVCHEWEASTKIGVALVAMASSHFAKELIFARNRTKARLAYGLDSGDDALIRRARELRIDGRSYSKIAAALQGEGFRTRSGAVWRPSVVRKLLLRNAVCAAKAA